MMFTNEYERREWFAREALKDMKRKYPNFLKWELIFTTDKYYEYDVFYFVLDLDSQSIKKRVWIELKIRDTSFDSYILEGKKLKSLIKKRENLMLSKDDVTFLYINFTPDGTIVWKLDDDMLESTEKLVANRRTADSRQDKINKDVIYLDPKDGKFFDYVICERSLSDNWEVEYLLPKVKDKIRTISGLEDILFG
jgi:hypothetical protein